MLGRAGELPNQPPRSHAERAEEQLVHAPLFHGGAKQGVPKLTGTLGPTAEQSLLVHGTVGRRVDFAGKAKKK